MQPCTHGAYNLTIASSSCFIPNPSVQLSLNEYADLSWAEFSSVKLGLNADLMANRPRGLSDEPFM